MTIAADGRTGLWMTDASKLVERTQFLPSFPGELTETRIKCTHGIAPFLCKSSGHPAWGPRQVAHSFSWGPPLPSELPLHPR